MTTFAQFSIVIILFVTFAGGYAPLFGISAKEVRVIELPRSESFAAGVFLALAMVMMIPSSLTVLSNVFPDSDLPIGSTIATIVFLVFLVLLGLRQYMSRRIGGEYNGAVPLLMTLLIAVPSFFLGTALGISGAEAAILILIAILVHKGSAAFALALQMQRSNLPRGIVLTAFTGFAFATPVGIVVGQEIQQIVTPQSLMIIKGVILGVAGGTFLFMSTLHNLARSPLIVLCGRKREYGYMLAGFILTAFVRLVLGVAHHL